MDAGGRRAAWQRMGEMAQFPTNPEGPTGTEADIDTPWGKVDSISRGANLRGIDGVATDRLAARTPHGTARLSFHANEMNRQLPEHLRVLLLCGYEGPVLRGAAADVERESTLKVGGAPLGWRAQAYLDPRTGLRAEGRPVEVMLAGRDGKMITGFPAANARVAQAVDDMLSNAAEASPGYAGRIYAAMMARMEADLEGDVEVSERLLKSAILRRDIARNLRLEVEEALAAPAAAPGP